MGRPARPMFPATETCSDGALSLDGAAEFAGGLSRDTIEKAIGRGEIESFRVGVRVLIAKNEMRRWLATKLEATRAEQACQRGG